jgi:hypothetical protein
MVLPALNVNKNNIVVSSLQSALIIEERKVEQFDEEVW